MTKILFLDLDGTLLNDQKEISEGNRKAIVEALHAGHKVVISTGRALSSAIELAEKLNFTMEGCYTIAYNGGCIYDIYKKEIVYQQTIPLEYVRYLLDTAHKMGIHAQTYSDTAVISEKDNENLHQYCCNTHMTYEIAKDACAALSHPPCKVLIVDYQNRKPLEYYQETIEEWAKGKVDTYFSCDQLLEVVPPSVSKGNAIRILCEHLNIPMDSTISAGDAENDISMLQTTHVSVVMKNASPHMYAYATYITDHDNNHDGVAEIIEKFMLDTPSPQTSN